MYVLPTRNQLSDAGMWVIKGKKVFVKGSTFFLVILKQQTNQ